MLYLPHHEVPLNNSTGKCLVTRHREQLEPADRGRKFELHLRQRRQHTHENGRRGSDDLRDFENRLISVQLPNGAGIVAYKADPFGRRIYRSGPSGTTIWNYDGPNIIDERDGTGMLVAAIRRELESTKH